MANLTELTRMFGDGKLTELLAIQFGVIILHTPCLIKDADSIFRFRNGVPPPTLYAIRRTVRDYYVGLGYEVESARDDSEQCASFLISHSASPKEQVSIKITTPYLHEDNNQCLRMTCELP